MLKAWKDFVCRVDPDIITGYNIERFDLPYIIERGKGLIGRQYAQFSRFKNTVASTSDTQMEGRILFAMYGVILSEYRLTSYKLDFVSSHFLGEQRQSVYHTDIAKLQNGDNFSRRRIAECCI